MRLINLIGLFLLLLSFAVEGQNLAIRQPGKINQSHKHIKLKGFSMIQIKETQCSQSLLIY